MENIVEEELAKVVKKELNFPEMKSEVQARIKESLKDIDFKEMVSDIIREDFSKYLKSTYPDENDFDEDYFFEEESGFDSYEFREKLKEEVRKKTESMIPDFLNDPAIEKSLYKYVKKELEKSFLDEDVIYSLADDVFDKVTSEFTEAYKTKVLKRLKELF